MSIVVQPIPRIIFDTESEREAATYIPDGCLCFCKDVDKAFMKKAGTWVNITGTGGSAVWGDITGTLSAQTDLQGALDGKAASGHNHALNNLSEKSYNSLTDKPSSFPPDSHDNTKHSTAFATDSDLDAHTGAASPHSGHLNTSAFSGLTKITVGTSQPGSPNVGDLWIDVN